jgi:Uma2 family endonuclease
MSIAAPPPVALLSGAQPGQCLTLPGLSWDQYRSIRAVLADRPAVRLTFDEGTLEIMVTSPWHEILKKRLSRIVEILAEELAKPFATAGNMTFQQEELEKALEADDCFWFKHEAQMRAKATWDAHSDPPPDLALEIEVSRRVSKRPAIYASLKVEEVWCSDGDKLTIYQLDAAGEYQAAATSRVFPDFPVDKLSAFIRPDAAKDVLTFTRELRAWIRAQLADKGRS